MEEQQKGSPLSLVMTKEGKYGSVLSSMLVVEIVVDVALWQEENGMFYFNWEIIPTRKYLGRVEDLNLDFPVLLLPKLNQYGTTDADEIGMYTAINDRWMKMNENGEWSLY